MPPRLQTPDYSFIGAAGAQIASGVRAVGQEIDTSRAKKQQAIDFKKHWKEIETVYDGYKDAISEIAEENKISSEDLSRDIQSMTPPSLMRDNPEGFVKVMGKQYTDIVNKYEEQGKQQAAATAGQQIITDQPKRPVVGEPIVEGSTKPQWGEFGEELEGERPKYSAARPAAATQEQFMGRAATEFPQIPAEQLQEGAAYQSLPSQKEKSQEERYAKADITARIKAETAASKQKETERKQLIKEQREKDKLFVQKQKNAFEKMIKTANTVKGLDDAIIDFGIEQGVYDGLVEEADEDIKSISQRIKEEREGNNDPAALSELYSKKGKLKRNRAEDANMANETIPAMIERAMINRKSIMSSGGGSYTGGGGQGSQEQTNPYSPQALALRAKLIKKNYSEDKIKEAMDKLRGLGK